MKILKRLLQLILFPFGIISVALVAVGLLINIPIWLFTGKWTLVDYSMRTYVIHMEFVFTGNLIKYENAH